MESWYDKSPFLNPLDQLDAGCVASMQHSFAEPWKVGPFTRYPNYLHPHFPVLCIDLHINPWIYSATIIKSYLGPLFTPFLILSLRFYCGCLNTYFLASPDLAAVVDDGWNLG